ncbi:MAG: hypothetical protein ABIY35_00785 [Chitinophagaceae bacterium]
MKKFLTFKTGLAAFMLLAISCNKEPLPTQALPDTQMENTTALTGHVGYIGERFGGGIIFYINSSGKHGMIADTVDLAPATWSNVTNVLTGASGSLVGTGRANTHKIVLAQGRNGNYAALECAKSTHSGFTDWFLPSSNELFYLNSQKDIVGGFKGSYYYSSTEANKDECFLEYWPVGWFDLNFKLWVISVRAIRYY